jgi:[ribosomal protein S5]-alanine N-acetyltransferase
MSPYIQTARTTLRPFIEADAEAAFEWFGDAEVMRFTPAGPDITIAHTRERIIRYIQHQTHHGFSKWLILERESGLPIGDAGLQLLEELGPVPDVGFRLIRSRWQRGLATEVAAAWVLRSLTIHGLDRLNAFAHVDNVASHRVLEKVGFLRTKREMIMGMDSFTYVLVRQQGEECRT